MGFGGWKSGTRPPSAVDHRSVHRRPISRCATRMARCGSSSTARSITTPTSARELEQLGGHRWKTDHSDTEVIVARLRAVGHRLPAAASAACSPLPSGTPEARELWLVRDRIGIKPLYYSVHHGRHHVRLGDQGAAARSRTAARRRRGGVLPLPFVPDDPCAADAVSTASRSSRPAPGCASMTTAGRGTALLGRLGPHRAAGRLVDDEIAERLLAELRTAVQLRKVSDVPVGVFLSGGIDSSTNAALFSEGEAQPVKTFSHRLRGRLRHLPQRTALRPADGRRRGRRASRAAA